MGVLRHNLVKVIGAAMLLMLTCVAREETVTAPDYKVKAGFIYNFAKLTQWPTNAFKSNSSPIKIGIVGTDTLADYLEKEIKDRFIEGRKLTVTRYKPSLLATNCHILFIDSSACDQIDEIPAAVRDRPILTIGESSKFISVGGIIRLVRKGDALQFELRRGAAERAGITFSSKLLALARIVQEKKQP